ncbi:MAG: CHRD domain-containing protein [Chloroflexota bacterium]
MNGKTNRTRIAFWALGIALFGLILTGCNAAGDEAEMAAEMEAGAHADHGMAMADEHTPEIEMESPIPLNPGAGKEIGFVYEAYLSPEQEGEDEEDTPELAPEVFKSTAPSVPRVDRPSHGHGVLSFTNDLSEAYVHIAIEDVNPEDIVMFHIHCGKPGQLGPIIVDFGLKGDHTQYFEDGVFSMVVTNEDIVANTDHGEGVVGAFTAGCPIILAIPTDKVKTIAGMKTIADEGEIYFNLHTKGQTFYGDIRGQLQPVEIEN